jgi:hypothetical protein
MPAKLTDEKRRLRAMTPAQLADEVGLVKAQVSTAREGEEAIKAEMVRRSLKEAAGDLFRLALTEPSAGERLDTKALRAAKGDKFLKPFMVPSERDWVMNCYPLKRDPTRKVKA